MPHDGVFCNHGNHPQLKPQARPKIELSYFGSMYLKPYQVFSIYSNNHNSFVFHHLNHTKLLLNGIELFFKLIQTLLFQIVIIIINK